MKVFKLKAQCAAFTGEKMELKINVFVIKNKHLVYLHKEEIHL